METITPGKRHISQLQIRVRHTHLKSFQSDTYTDTEEYTHRQTLSETVNIRLKSYFPNPVQSILHICIEKKMRKNKKRSNYPPQSGSLKGTTDYWILEGAACRNVMLTIITRRNTRLKKGTQYWEKQCYRNSQQSFSVLTHTIPTTCRGLSFNSHQQSCTAINMLQCMTISLTHFKLSSCIYWWVKNTIEDC